VQINVVLLWFHAASVVFIGSGNSCPDLGSVFVFKRSSFKDMAPLMVDKKTVRILSIDGGGVRGVIPSTFLTRFCPQAGIDPTKVFESFDIIIGTSIGGLLSLGFAAGKTPSEMTQFFYDKGSSIFYYNSSLSLDAYKAGVILHPLGFNYNYTFYGVGDPDHPDDSSINGLKKALTEVLGANTKLSDLNGNLILTAWDADEDKAVLFSNLTQFPNYLIGSEFKAVEAGLATSAAPLYFPSSTIDGHKYIDGGVFQNNPEITAYAVAKQLFPTANRMCLLSVGTGVSYNDFLPPTLKLRNTSPLDPLTQDFQKELTLLKLKLLIKYPNQEEKVHFLLNAMQVQGMSDYLPYNVSYLFYLMDNVFIPGPQEANASLMGFIAEDLFDQIFTYRFQYKFLEGQDSALDNYDPANLDKLVGYANAQYDADALTIQNFINHFRAG
jgi:predicted acylesterase/phospholipase RssA